jgi:hypothetical protein
MGRGVRARARTWAKARSAENWLGGALALAGGGKAVVPRQDQASAQTQAMAATQLARPGDSGKADWVVTFFSLFIVIVVPACAERRDRAVLVVGRGTSFQTKKSPPRLRDGRAKRGEVEGYPSSFQR